MWQYGRDLAGCGQGSIAGSYDTGYEYWFPYMAGNFMTGFWMGVLLQEFVGW